MKWFKNRFAKEVEEIDAASEELAKELDKIEAWRKMHDAGLPHTSPPIPPSGTATSFPSGTYITSGGVIGGMAGSFDYVRMQTALFLLAKELGLKDADDVYSLLEEIRYRGDVT